MRKTYRNKSSKEYWIARWEKVNADSPMENRDKYPLSSSLDALKYGIQDKEKVKILEAGCGTGRILRYFHSRNYQIYGIDFADNAIKKIKNLNLDLNVSVGDVTDLNFENNSFSHVFAFGLYHNLEENDLSIALRETYRVLKEGGVLCASFRADNFQNLINDTFFRNSLNQHKKVEEAAPKKSFHKINLTKKEIEFFTENANFRTISIYEIENMPLVYKFKIFRDKDQKIFDENLGRKEGYILNKIGKLIQVFLSKYFGKHFCNLYVIVCEKI